jgi:type I restriction enzyme R subunit
MVPMASANFDFLKEHELSLVTLGAQAEQYFRSDPNTCLIKLRQFGELLAQLTAAKTALFTSPDEAQAELLRRLKFAGAIPGETGELFYKLRSIGNRATHSLAGEHSDALTNLKCARELGVWFHRTFADPKFKPGPFVPPPDPAAATNSMREELERLRKIVQEATSTADAARLAAEREAKARMSAEELARREREERTIWEQLAGEAEQSRLAVADELQALQAAASQAPKQVVQFIAQAVTAASSISLDEAATRDLIDTQLRKRGWEVDTPTLRYSQGTRPVNGRAMAIAEWPTLDGPADYALFIGTQCIGIVEAKRRNKNVSTEVRQAQRYSRGMRFEGGASPIGGPWSDPGEEPFLVPFVFSANGRPYLKQIETQSGIWFRDARRPTNIRRALVDWPTPDGLKGMLEVDTDVAQAQLAAQPIQFGFPLRPYQKRAIEEVEKTLAADRRAMLLAMATGTGKTKLAIGMLYRLLTAKRFRRVCFVVDRSALGTQAKDEFSTTRIVSAKTFADVFGLMGLGDVTPELETKVHICTIQGLVKRVLDARDDGPPPIDQYDLMVIDECHRGYLLDRELSDAELSFRSQEDYISKYRRVLEYFDAVKIGLTATPALHTAQIFGDPIYTYSYREAVVDGFLIDQEPPINITTALAKAGIVFAQGDEIELIDTRTGEVDLTHAPDEIRFEVEEFNKKVLTVDFNRVVAEELAKSIDPHLPGKTLVFAVSDAHADIVVDQLKKAFSKVYGEIEDAAIAKITGSVDRVGNLIRSYRNDSLPKVAVTVDLLTTGIDVPSIVNLVFLRRVNSRILYDQMIGRATRQCPEIGKETYRIFDAVDLYSHLQNLTDMRPVVVNPSISLEQLFEEFARVKEDAYREQIRDQMLVKLRRQLNRLPTDVREQYEAEAGETPEATLGRLRNEPPTETAEWVKARPHIGRILDWSADGTGPSYVAVSHHLDQVVSVTRGYGDNEKPEDFLDGFTNFIRTNLNEIAALTIVVQRPRELTREQLRALRLELDRKGFSEAKLRQAWKDTTNEEMAASIIGFVRQAALGDALVPYEDRLHAAMRRILASKPWTEVQRKWLKRIEEQLTREIVVDRAAIDDDPFRADGGFKRLNHVFGGQLELVLADINEEVWKKVA